ncbi:KAP family P-loop NTPase fold protein [Acinetobacter sp. TR11]|uniref:KAP family P-loop NTPase fold protein n=1 Tax=Acinetobacter sp. TR11 TaxID=3003393 RepID=UPI0022AC4ADE|nr:P-loop NTPase fold protein [Acinetobacter sp. TR11]WAU74305.1 P-loop NTPase fold protein [Acinetobacter sp. TR11]
MNVATKFIKDREEEITVPFQGDLWGRKQLSEKLTHFISNLQCGATIALDAEWGAGKTWFVKNWKAGLEANEYKVIYIDAFMHDFMEDPFLILSMEILNAVKADKTVSDDFKEKLVSAYHAILPNMPMLLWSLTMTLMGAGHFSSTVTQTLKDIKDGTGEFGEKAGELLEEKLREHLTNLVEDYNKSKNELGFFKDELTKLVKDLEKPLVFIVDELDRCKPEFSIKLIERIKHFFDIPNIVFILSTNKSQLEESINSFYGFRSANSYLEKFIDLNIKFPKRESGTYIEVIRTYLTKFGLRLNDNDILILSAVFNLNSRDLTRILQKLALISNHLNHSVSTVMAVIYLAMEQKSMNPSRMSEKEFLDTFMNLLTIYVKGQWSYNSSSFDFANLAKFADQYGDSQSIRDGSGFSYLLKYYYLEYTDDQLDGRSLEMKKALKDNLKASIYYHETDFVKSWDNCINSGFIVN